MLKNTSIVLAIVFALSPRAAAADEPATAPPPRPAFDKAAALDALRASIKGREEEKASVVFKNVEVLGDMPAGRLLRIMELGYSQSLGVSCDHCHIPGKWELDDVPGKEIARDMVKMQQTINADLLASIEGLQSNPETPFVNCTTCHRGKVKPSTSMEK